MSTREVQITEVKISRKVNVPKEYVKNLNVEETLRNHNRINASFSEFIANPKVVNEQRGDWTWVVVDQLVPTEAGRYEIVRKEDKNGTVAVSLLKVTSDEKWGALAKENKLNVTEGAAKRNGRLAVFVDGWVGRLVLGADSGPHYAGRVAEIEPEKTEKIVEALRVGKGEMPEVTLPDGQKMQIDASAAKVVKRQ